MTRLELATPTLARLCATNCATSAHSKWNMLNYATKETSMGNAIGARSLPPLLRIPPWLGLGLWVLSEAVGSLAVDYQVNSRDLILALDSEANCFLDCETNYECKHEA